MLPLLTKINILFFVFSFSYYPTMLISILHKKTRNINTKLLELSAKNVRQKKNILSSVFFNIFPNIFEIILIVTNNFKILITTYIMDILWVCIKGKVIISEL